MRKNAILILLLSLITITSLPAQQPLLQFPINPKVFIPNNGQVKDQRGRVNAEVKYLFSDHLFNLALKPGGFSYELFQVINENGNDESGCFDKYDDDRGSGENGFLRSYRIDVSFEGANRYPDIIASDPADASFNFYYAPVASPQQLGITGYQKVIYRDLYPGIDLVFYAPNSTEDTPLKYEFIVHPGADASKIKFHYSEGTSLSINENGDAQFQNQMGFVTETRPVCFVDGNMNPVGSSFVTEKNSKSFHIDSYDKNRFLIIDPNIVYGSYYGGSLGDEVSELALDTKKKAIITGQTISTNNIASSGAFQQQYAGGVYDFFIAKFKVNGTLEWGTYFGGKGKEYSYGVTTDPSDNIIMVGNSTSNNLSTIGYDSVKGNADILIAKFSPEGLLVWCTYMGGTQPENSRAAVCDAQGNIYCCGASSSTTGIATPNAYQVTLGGKDDTWIAKFSPDGNRIWSTYYGGNLNDRSHAITLDDFGHVFVTGTAESLSGISTPGSFQPNYAGGETDAYLAKLDTSGNMIWATYYGGAWADRARGVVTDADGDPYLAGFTESDSGIATPGSFQEHWTEGYESPGDRAEDAFLVKFSPGGLRHWGTYYGGERVEELWGMTLDRKTGAIYLVGSTQSNTFIVYGNPLQAVKGGGEDGFIGKFHLNGALEWGTYWGGPASEQFEDIATDKNSYIYLTGRATTNTDPVTLGTYQENFGGGVSDAFVYKFYAGSDCQDSYEPNDVMSAAPLMKASLPTDSTIYGYNGSIRNGGDEDWYKLKMTSNEPNLMIILNDLPANYDLKLFNKSGIQKGESLNTGETADTIIANNLVAGNFFIQVAHSDLDYDSLGCYRIRFLKSANTFAQKTGTFSLDGQDITNFSVYPNPVNDQLAFSITAPTSGQAGIIIYDQLNRKVYAGDMQLSEGLQHLSIFVGSLTAGNYQLVIQSKNKFWLSTFAKF